MISKKNQKVLITDIGLLQLNNSLKEFPLYVKSLKKFFFCTSKSKKTSESRKSDKLVLTILPIIFGILIVAILVTVYTIDKKKMKFNDEQLSLST